MIRGRAAWADEFGLVTAQLAGVVDSGAAILLGRPLVRECDRRARVTLWWGVSRSARGGVSAGYDTVYDSSGLPVRYIEPGGIIHARIYDALGRLFGRGNGGFYRNLRGEPTIMFWGASQINSYTWEDRGLPLSGSGHDTSFTYSYDANGRPVSRTDAAGSAAFAWTARGELAHLDDPQTGLGVDYGYDPDGRAQSVTYAGGARRDYAWDAAGRLASDVYKDPAGTTRWSAAYSYDPNGNVSSETIGPATVAGAGSYTYGYDRADRLITMTAPGPTTTSYGYYPAGNRTTAGTVTYSYNERDQLVGDSTGAVYGWDAAGRLVNDNGTVQSFDTLGRLTGRGAVTYSYDPYDRIAKRNSASFSYNGHGIDAVSDNTFTVTQDPAGGPVTYRTGTTKRFVITDRHDDLTGLINTTNWTLAGSYGYDPYGTRTAQAGANPPRVGYQSDYTDPTSSQVHMGARWYGPGLDSFHSRDSYEGTISQPASRNHYTYANNNPLKYTDPTGHCAICAAVGIAQRYSIASCAENDTAMCAAAHNFNRASTTGLAMPTTPAAAQQFVATHAEIFINVFYEPPPVTPQQISTAKPTNTATVDPETAPRVARQECARAAYRGEISRADIDNCLAAPELLDNILRGNVARAYVQARGLTLVDSIQADIEFLQTLMAAAASGIADVEELLHGVFTQPFVDCFGSGTGTASRSIGCGQIALTSLPLLNAAIRQLFAVEDAADALAALRRIERTVDNATETGASGGRLALNAAADVDQWAGSTLSRVTQTDEVMYRVWGGGSGRAGEWLTPINPSSSAAARAGLALPEGNSATYVSRVVVPAGTRVQVGVAGGAFGQPGGWVQVRLVDQIPLENFGKGTVLAP
jgi:RHS repeat-associated protein